jgi:monoamine oxidase
MESKFSQVARTPLYAAWRRTMRLARLARRPGMPPLDELIEMRSSPTLEIPGPGGWTRRRFLKTSSAAAALTLAGGGLLTSCVKTKGAAPRIAIVGAGIAGLNAAYKLKQSGYRAEIYEASKRVGGRIYTAKDIMAPGLFTELGGEWLDEDHEDMFSLVEEFGLELSDRYAPGENAFRSSNYFEGTNYTDAQVVEAVQPLAARMEDDINTLEEAYRVGNEDDDWEKASSLMSPLDNISMAEYLDRIGVTGWIRVMVNGALTSDGGLDSDQQSALNLIDSVSLNASPNGSARDASEPVGKSTIYLLEDAYTRYKVVGGFQGVIRGLAERVEGQIKLGHRLEAVKSKGDGFLLTFEGPNGAATDVEADFVIMTIPFSVLRNVEMQIEMPPMKKKAIAEVGYGIHAKVLAGVNKRVWREMGYIGHAYSDEPFLAMWDNSQLAGYEGDAGGLTFCPGGQAGIDAGAGTAPEQAERFMLGAEKIFPGVSAARNGKTHRFNWGTYPFSMGSYPCYKVGQWTAFYSLGAPVGNMLFAGGHCSDGFQGYMEGGAETGRNAAETIAARLGKSKKA